MRIGKPVSQEELGASEIARDELEDTTGKREATHMASVIPPPVPASAPVAWTALDEDIVATPAPLATLTPESPTTDPGPDFSLTFFLDSFRESITCPTCKGRPCLTCSGEGKVLGVVGLLLREARAKLTPKLEQNKMAELLGISPAYLSTMERGDKRFTDELALEYLKILLTYGWKPSTSSQEDGFEVFSRRGEFFGRKEETSNG